MKNSIIRFVVAIGISLICLQAPSMREDVRLFLGSGIAVPSCILLIMSRRQLGRSFSIIPEAKELVVHGLYSRIQHPMYVFLDFFFSGFIIATGLSILLAPLCLLVLVQVVRGQKEEKLLREKYGAKYDSYVSRIWF